MSVQRATKKPVTVECFQWTGEVTDELRTWLVDVEWVTYYGSDELRIPTLEGVMVASDGDWIIRGVQGVYPCKPDIFAATYDLEDPS